MRKSVLPDACGASRPPGGGSRKAQLLGRQLALPARSVSARATSCRASRMRAWPKRSSLSPSWVSIPLLPPMRIVLSSDAVHSLELPPLS